MAVFFPTKLIAGWVVSSLKPKQLSATVVVKATYCLKPGAAPEPIEDSDERDAPVPEQFSGDRYADDDPAKALLYPGDFARSSLARTCWCWPTPTPRAGRQSGSCASPSMSARGARL